MELLIVVVLFLVIAFILYHFISSAVESGNKELVHTVKESTSKICEELRKAKESNENK